MHPVQTSNWIGEKFATLRLWVSFLLTETTQTEKAKDCVIVWRVSIIKLSFLDNFGWISSISFGIDFFANRNARRWFSALFIATKSLEAEIAETFSYVSFFSLFELVSWNYQLYFTNQAVNRLFLLEIFTKMTLGFVPCIGKLNNRSFFSSTCSYVFSRNSPTYLQNLRLYSSDQGVNRQFISCYKFFWASCQLMPFNPHNRNPIGRNYQK